MERYEFELIPVPSEALMEIGLIPGAAAEAFVDEARKENAKEKKSGLPEDGAVPTDGDYEI